MTNTLPRHPRTGLLALGFTSKGKAIWPALGGSEEDSTFALPETLPTTAAELEALHDEALAAFNELFEQDRGGEAISAADLEELTRLQTAVKTVNQAIETTEAEATARTEAAAALAAELAPEETPEETPEQEEARLAEEAAAAETPAEERESVTASAKRTPVAAPKAGFAKAGRAARSASRSVPAPARSPLGFAISSDVPRASEYPAQASTMDLAVAFDQLQAKRMPAAGTGNGMLQYGIGSLSRGFDTSLVASSDEHALEIIERITDEKQLTNADGDGGSLVAAGGWCSPSEIVYDFLGVPDAADLLDLPELGIRRGGIRFPVEPDFSAIYDATGFFQTEAQAIAGVAKTCYEVPCVGFDEVRLDAIGICITAGLLQNNGYPEAVKRFIDGALVAHQHKVSKRSIDAIVADSDAVTIPPANVFGAVAALLNSVELAVEDYRTKHRLPSTTTLEIILPTWAKVLMRADLAYRENTGADVITDALLIAHFAARSVSVQFISDWQTGATGQPGAAGFLTKLPTTIQFAIYSAGTWFRAINPVIELGTIYDNAMLKQNRYTALFTEDGIAIGKRGVDSRVYTVPVLANGSVGERLSFGNKPSPATAAA